MKLLTLLLFLVLEVVDEEIDRTVECCEEVAEAGDIGQPARPHQLMLG